ncbi:Ribosomal protein lysine methyltransferase [Rhodotorula kratochvilovae]
MIRTPASLSLPPDSTLVEDVDEEIFVLYTRKLQLASSSAADGASGAHDADSALGYLSGREGVLPVSLTIANPALRPTGATAKEAKGGRTKGKKGKARGRDEVLVEVEVHQALDALRHRKGDTASVLWRTSIHLAHYLLQSHHFPSASAAPLLPSLRTSTILELGSGTGFLGLALRSIWADEGRWVFSDQLENLPLVLRNLRANGLLPPVRTAPPPPAGKAAGVKGSDAEVQRPQVELVELDWLAEAAAWDRHPGSLYASTSPIPATAALQAPPDVILACDCVYNPSLSGPLAKTLLRHAGPRTVVLVACELRDEEPLEAFLRAWVELGAKEQWKQAPLTALK